MRSLLALVFALLLPVAHAQQAPAQPGLFETLGKLLQPAPEAAAEPAPNDAPAATRSVAGSGERRVALVIGNNAYRNVGKLDNAVPDARAMAREFRGLGFEVIEKTDVDQRTMKAAVRDFVARIANGGVGAFFYAGHGIQEGGNNYLLPVDIGALTDVAALPDEAVELNGEVMARIGQAGAKFSLLVVDACRDNPFPKKAGRSIGGTRGLTAAANAPEGMIVVYSAGVGQQALDRLGDADRDPNGLFTREFIREIRKPGLEVAEVVRNVRKRVKDQAATIRHDQTPAIYIQADRFYLIPDAKSVTIQAAAAPEDALWAQFDPARPCEYQAYLDQYPRGKFAALARMRLKDCGTANVPAADKAAASSTGATAQPPAVAQDAETQFWNEVKASGAKEYLDAYVKQYPKGKYVALAKVELKKLDEREKQEAQRAEQQTWESAKADNGATAYAGYLERYPKGRYAALAQAGQQKAQREAAEREKLEALRAQREKAETAQREEAEHWHRAESAKDSVTVQGYLDRYPAGRYVGEARTKLAAVKKEEAELRPGKVFKDCAECQEMVILPAGSFDMGSNDGDSDEKPVHRVSIAKPFALGKTEVTQGQWRAIMGGNPSRFTECGDTCPVEKVSWNDVQEFIRKLNAKTGKQYRLPSEAEWEYAARTGTTTKYFWGNEIGRNNANCDGCGSQWDNKTTAPVGSFKANAFGLHDMSGNVWEWVEDCWNGSYNGAPVNGSAWTAGDCKGRVVRGGSWYNNPWIVRSTHRREGTPGLRFNYVGFRLARTLLP